MKSLKLCKWIFVSFLMLGLLGCGSEDPIDEELEDIITVSDEEGQQVYALSSSSSADPFILILENTLRVEFSDGEKLVLEPLGSLPILA